MEAARTGSVRLNKLNSAEWNKTKARVKKAVADMADELIRLYAQRMQAKGFAFDPDNDWQREFEARSPMRRLTTSSAASTRSSRIWSGPSPWTGCSAAMWASARPRWPSGRHSSA